MKRGYQILLTILGVVGIIVISFLLFNIEDPKQKELESVLPSKDIQDKIELNPNEDLSWPTENQDNIDKEEDLLNNTEVNTDITQEELDENLVIRIEGIKDTEIIDMTDQKIFTHYEGEFHSTLKGDLIQDTESGYIFKTETRGPFKLNSMITGPVSYSFIQGERSIVVQSDLMGEILVTKAGTIEHNARNPSTYIVNLPNMHNIHKIAIQTPLAGFTRVMVQENTIEFENPNINGVGFFIYETPSVADKITPNTESNIIRLRIGEDGKYKIFEMIPSGFEDQLEEKELIIRG